MKARDVSRRMRSREATSGGAKSVWLRVVLPLLVCLLLSVVLWLAVRSLDGERTNPAELSNASSAPISEIS